MALYSLYTISARPLPAQVTPTPLPEHDHTRTGMFRLHAKFPSKHLTAERDVLIYLPPDYATNSTARFPVLYLQDGQNLFDGATSFIPGKEWRVDETAEELIRQKAIRPIIIVGIYNAGIHRLNEYTPTATSRFKEAGQADKYGKFLIEELKPFMDKQYRTRTGREDTALGGSSLGGLVSLYLGLKHPDVFGKLLVVSPSVWWDNKVIIKRVKALKQHPKTQIWLDMGTHEGSPPAQQRNIEDARALRDALINKGWKLDTDLRYMEADGAEHNEEAWAERVAPMLKFLFGVR